MGGGFGRTMIVMQHECLCVNMFGLVSYNMYNIAMFFSVVICVFTLLGTLYFRVVRKAYCKLHWPCLPGTGIKKSGLYSIAQGHD